MRGLVRFVFSCSNALNERSGLSAPCLLGTGCRTGLSELIFNSKLLIKKKLQNRLYISRDSYSVVLGEISLIRDF